MQQNEEPRRRAPRIAATILLVFVFFSGLVLGIAGDRAVLLKEGRVLPKEGMRIMTSRIVRAMDRELDLSEGQKAEIEKILDRRREHIDQIWSGVRPEVRAEIDRTNREIEAQLTSEQKVRFEKILMRWERRIEKLVGPRIP